MTNRTPARRRVLIVDDDPVNLDVLEGHLSSFDVELTRAHGGVEALEAVDRDEPDLILLDLRMPDLDGIDVLTHVRARTDRPHVPVILVTAHSDREQRVRGLEAGADEFLEKPIDRAVLLARVRMLLRLKEAGDALAERNAALERLRREQRELTAFVVHDLKNPLAVAQMNVAWALESAESTLAEGIVDANEALGRLRRMIEDLLVIARLEHAELPLRREVVAVGRLLDEVARAHARAVADKRIELRVAAREDVQVAGDPAILRRLVENVVENAIRHTPVQGRIALAVRQEGPVEIAVANTGRPIPIDERDRIFDRGARGADAPAGAMNVGLGLYFCRRAAEVHGGAIHVRQSDEYPTSFVIRLPAA